jgi:hypothetical protein
MDNQHPGERHRLWLACGVHGKLPAPSDDRDYVYCVKCWSLFDVSAGQVSPGPGMSIGRLVNQPSLK